MNNNEDLPPEFDQPAVYEIVVSGAVSPGIYRGKKCIIAGSELMDEGKVKTVLIDLFPDKARLGEMLNLIYEQQLTIISVRKLSD